MALTAHDAQLAEQLKLSELQVCTAYRVPPYKVGVGAAPPYQSAALLDAQYYSQCLQTLIEHVEALMSAGLGLAPSLAVELDLDGLFRMDAEAPGTGGRHAGQTVRPGRYSRDLLRRQSRPASQVA